MSEIPVVEIVGFDLGHGETAVAKVSAETDADPELLEIHGKKSQITVIGRHPLKGVVIGERALIVPGMVSFDICFKHRPTSDPAYQQNMREFLAACYRHLVEQDQIRDGAGASFFVGCPSGWGDDTIADYERLLLTSGIPSLHVVRESRAALLHAKEGGKLTLSELQRSVLVIDMGSSTTDFTLVRGFQEQPLDFGEELGAALIDQAILAHTLDAHEQGIELREIFRQHPLHRARCEMQCRKAKEAYFSNEDLYDDPDSRTQTGFERIQEICIFEPVVNRPIMQKLLNQPLSQLDQHSWIQRFKELVAGAKRQLDEQGVTPSVLLLTGGASRMGFVRDVCQSVFPDSNFRRDSEPEFCIARGLARWGRVDLRTAGFRQEVAELLGSALPDLLSRHIPVLKDALSGCLAGGLADSVVKIGLLDWREGKVPTVAALEAHLQKLAEQWIESPTGVQDIAKCCDTWFEPVQQELNNRTNEICQKHRIPVGALALHVTFDTSGWDPSTIKWEGPNPAAGIANVGAVITVLVIASLLGGGGTALLMAGPVGWVIGLLIGLVATYCGKDKAERWIKELEIPPSVRKVLLGTGKIEKQSAEMTSRLRLDVRAQLDKRPESFEELARRLKEQLDGVMDEKVREAKLLIR